MHSLQILVARNETNKLVTDLADLDRVRSPLETISILVLTAVFEKEKGREVWERYVILVLL